MESLAGTMLDILYYIIPFVVLLGILVFVHEFGHFIVARWLGVTVTDFSIGFGKELWHKTDKHGTRWKLSAIPLGGYCQFLGDSDASSSTVADLSELSATAKAGAFPLQKAWKKLAIVAAGPLFNYLFAIMIFIGLFYSFGRLVYPPVVGGLLAGEAAEEAGIEVGDIIKKVNGHATADFHEISNEVLLAPDGPVEILIERPQTISLKAEEIEFIPCGSTEKTTQKILGINSLPAEVDSVGNELPTPAVVGSVVVSSAADKVDLRRGDIIESVNGVEMADFAMFKNYVATHINEEMTLKVRRPLTFYVTLRETDFDAGDGQKVKRRMLGVMSSQEVSFVDKDMSFWNATKAGFVEAYDLTANTLRAVGQMITGQRGSKEVGGIIRIAEMSGDVSKKGGLINFIYFMALLSVNLGLINLLPIPVLDGGNFVIFLLEMITGRELNAKVKDYIFKLGLLIILAIMVLATWNDVVHLISRWFD